MLTVLAHGTLIADPIEARASNDTPSAHCTMQVLDDDGEPVLVTVLGYSPQVVAALMALRRGVRCTVAGRAKLAFSLHDGIEQHGLSVVADRVL